MESEEYKGRIRMDSKIHFGKPCVAGTRIPVEDVLELVQEGLPFETIITEYYPALTLDDIKACVKYATNIIKHEEIHLDVA